MEVQRFQPPEAWQPTLSVRKIAVLPRGGPWLEVPEVLAAASLPEAAYFRDNL
jgi:hypothetical protein